MGRMADARKRARQKSGAEPPAAPAPAPEETAPDVEPAAAAEPAPSEEAPPPEDRVFPVDEAEAAPAGGERIALPASGLAEDILAGLGAGAEPLASPVSLPASGLAEEILGQVEGAAPVVETPGGGHSLSFFAAPAQQAKIAVE